MLKVGERAGFVISATGAGGENGGTVKLVGYGVYEGEFIPPVEISPSMNALCIPNPRIKLDSGQVAYGFEGYWGSEEKFKEFVGKHANVVNVDIDQYRKENPQ
jgi:hypothetical protein